MPRSCANWCKPSVGAPARVGPAASCPDQTGGGSFLGQSDKQAVDQQDEKASDHERTPPTDSIEQFGHHREEQQAAQPETRSRNTHCRRSAPREPAGDERGKRDVEDPGAEKGQEGHKCEKLPKLLDSRQQYVANNRSQAADQDHPSRLIAIYEPTHDGTCQTRDQQ